MCKEYGGKPSVDLLQAFLNLGQAGNWLTLSNRGGPGIPKALTKPITHIEGWKGNFFFIENKIVPSEYLELLLENNKLDKKYFKDLVPTHVREDPLYNQIATYPCNVQTFPDPILYLAGLKTSWKHRAVEGVDGEFHFLPEGGLNDEGSSPSTKSVNNEAPEIDVEPLNTVHPTRFPENIGDSDDAPLEQDKVTLIECTNAEKTQNQRVNASSKATGKRKQTAEL
ncbi:hypothetical protein Tco_0690447 [Tanacetum coccineum]